MSVCSRGLYITPFMEQVILNFAVILFFSRELLYYACAICQKCYLLELEIEVLNFTTIVPLQPERCATCSLI